MYTQPNKMLQNTARIIKPYACAMIATEGPNILGKLDLAGVEIKYDSQYTSRIVLKANSTNQPLMYGFLGNDVTFLLLKVTFDETNPYCLIEEDQYIEYYFKDSPSEIRYINKLMVLSGNSTKRIPQVYLNNPSDYDVVIDVMVGNMDQDSFDSNVIPNNVILVSGIYHNNILSDQIYNAITGNYGSSQFSILDFEGNFVLYMNYDEIDTIQLDEKTSKIIIETKSDTTLHLEFLSVFEMYQGYSRIDWVMKDRLNRNLTTDLPSIDSVAPIFTLKQVTPVYQNIYTPHIDSDESGIFVYSKSDIVNYLVSSVIDGRDGEINVENMIVSIRKFGELLKIDEITTEGAYDIIIQTSDNANNQSILSYTLVVDVTKPVVTFLSDSNTYTLSITTDGSANVITKDIIKTKTISSITDNIDSILSTTTSDDLSLLQTKTLNVNINNSNGDEVSEISEVGTYTLFYIANDSSNNIDIIMKTLVVNV